jgi:HD-GYP domain-containing protein (c-di-GMP phosphodiesterase class II)
LGVNEQDVELLRVAATLHDIGKTCIPDDILTKGEALTPQEWEIMKSHARKGYELLIDSTSQTHQLGAVIAHEHHENWDGSGYPRGLKGEEINLYGRIAAVADVLDSLASESAYKKAWSLDDAIAYVQTHSGTRFDPKLVALVESNRAEIEKIYTH